ncbi:hypothetical protein BJ170DRAFT_626152 [Xylariales sp. AK1849]|nr:hypothetical protein BJ170DRAFT_626152 [Xylariales sp. AK1849]
MATSPSKRRVLAALDVNAQSPARNTKLAPSKTPLSQKRSIDNSRLLFGEIPPAKRACTSATSMRAEQCGLPTEDGRTEEQERDRSNSPEDSSMFDNSVVDTSQATTFTEPDIDPLAPSPRPPRRQTLTREEARQKAEILRLRLGLARYKLRTGQENVPLERLQLRRIPDGQSAPQLPRLSSSQQDADAEDATEEESEAHREALLMARPQQISHAHPSPEKNLLPRLPPVPLDTPTRMRLGNEDDGPTSSAVKGGAAKGLLSLSRA